MSSQAEILAGELAYLRSRFEDAMGEIRAKERYALVITGAVWSWCATNEASFATVLWWFPTLACFLLGIRSLATYATARSIHATVQRIHEDLQMPGALSWERSNPLNRLRAATFFTFWLTIQPATFAVAHFFSSKNEG